MILVPYVVLIKSATQSPPSWGNHMDMAWRPCVPSHETAHATAAVDAVAGEFLGVFLLFAVTQADDLFDWEDGCDSPFWTSAKDLLAGPRAPPTREAISHLLAEEATTDPSVELKDGPRKFQFFGRCRILKMFFSGDGQTTAWPRGSLPPDMMTSTTPVDVQSPQQRQRRPRFHAEVGGLMQQAAIDISGSEGVWEEKLRSISSSSLSTTETDTSPSSVKSDVDGASQENLCEMECLSRISDSTD
eukprot:s978_g28.t1